MLQNYCHLLISRCIFEELCQQTLICEEKNPAISKSPILHNKSKGCNICVTLCISITKSSVIKSFPTDSLFEVLKRVTQLLPTAMKPTATAS